MMSVTILLTTLLVSSVTCFGSAKDERCEDCQTIVMGLQEASLSNQSLSMQRGMIVSNICPEADLGAPEDHPNCEKFTEHHFEDLANSLFPYFLSPSLCASDLGFCPMPFKGYKEVDCDSCQSVSRLVAGVLGQENTIIDLVEFLATNFCLTGVPEDDVEFCDRYVRTVMPGELQWMASTVDQMAPVICGEFQLC